MKKVAAALAAGNSLVVKPSELGPAVPARPRHPAGGGRACRPVSSTSSPGLGATTGRALSEHRGARQARHHRRHRDRSRRRRERRPRPDSGHRRTRWQGTRHRLRRHATSKTLLPGRCSPSFIATGQTCVQGSRLLVQRRHLRRGSWTGWSTAPRELAARRPARPPHPDRSAGVAGSTGQGRDGRRPGPRAGGERADAVGRSPRTPRYAAGWFYEPTLVAEVKPDHDLWREEVFGPVTVVVPFDDEDDAVAKANDCRRSASPRPSGPRDVGRACGSTRALDIGIVWINDHHRIDPASPWGGSKDSGHRHRERLGRLPRLHPPAEHVVNTSRERFDWFATTGGGS